MGGRLDWEAMVRGGRVGGTAVEVVGGGGGGAEVVEVGRGPGAAVEEG